MRDEVHPVREDEADAAAPEGTHAAADRLLGVAGQIDLDLKILVAMRGGLRRLDVMFANIKVEMVRGLGHAVGFDTAQIDYCTHVGSGARGGAADADRRVCISLVRA